VALSGIASSGKTTQRDLLVEHLTSTGHRPVVIWSRAGYTPGLRSAKRLLRRLAGKGASREGEIAREPGRYPRRAVHLPHPLQRKLWLTLALLDLLWLYVVRLRWWRARGRSVVCDRYLLDCIVDFRTNFPDDRVERGVLCRLLRWLCVRPDVAICMLITPSESAERSRRKQRFHWEKLAHLEQRCEAYRAAAEELGVEQVDGQLPPGDIADLIRSRVRRAAGGSAETPRIDPTPPSGRKGPAMRKSAHASGGADAP